MRNVALYIDTNFYDCILFANTWTVAKTEVFYFYTFVERSVANSEQAESRIFGFKNAVVLERERKEHHSVANCLQAKSQEETNVAVNLNGGELWCRNIHDQYMQGAIKELIIMLNWSKFK